MILGGDEIARTQQGNNNAYCQDNELTWFDWNLDDRKQGLLNFTRKLIKIRLSHPVLHQRKFYQDRKIRGSEGKDVLWLRPDGGEMTDEEWGLGWTRSLGVVLNGRALGDVDEHGEEVVDDSFLLLLNCHHEPIQFFAPKSTEIEAWHVLVDTNESDLPEKNRILNSDAPYNLTPLSLVLACTAKVPSEARKDGV
jgi:isoamylase